MRKLRSRIKLLFSFPEESFAFGVPMSGQSKKDLYIFIFACTVGMFFAVSTGFPGASPLYSAFLKDELKVSNTLYGFFNALPYFAAVLQIPFAAYVQRKPHIKTYYIAFSLITRLNFVLIGLISYLMRETSGSKLVIIVLLIQSVTSVFWWVSDLCFSLWSGSACPSACSGRFFSTRQMSFTAAQLVYAFALTLLLNGLADRPEKYLLIFTLAGIAGCLEILSFLFVRPPVISPQIPSEEGQSPKASPLAPFRRRNYRNLLIFSTLWYFGCFIQGPFNNVFMLEHLHVPISRQTLYGSLLPGLATIIFIRLFGRLSDRYGYRNTLLLYSALAACSSALWLFVTPQTEGLIAVCNFIWGIVGAATDLATFSMGIYLAPEGERAAFLSVKTFCINLLGIAPAILLGGILMDKLKPLFDELRLPFIMGQHLLPYHVITIIAIVLRLFDVFVFARRLEPDNELSFVGFLKKFTSVTRFRFRLFAGLPNDRGK